MSRTTQGKKMLAERKSAVSRYMSRYSMPSTLALALVVSGATAAQDYPVKAVTVKVAFPAGGPADAGRALAIASSKRNPLLPELPTFSEHAKLAGFEYGLWSGILAPPGTPEPVVDRLTGALGNWLRSPEYHERTADRPPLSGPIGMLV